MFFNEISKWGRTMLAGVAVWSAVVGADVFAKEHKDKEAKEIATATTKSDEKLASAEIEGRRVIIPPDLNMDLDWYSPVVNLKEAGKITRGWVAGDLILLETAKFNLIAVRREDGTERWRCVLNEPLRYEPTYSKNNVVVNVNNFLVGIDKDTGDIRWRLLPDFAMSNTPIVIDPPAYPRKYEKPWSNMESIYVGDWKGRLQSLWVRGHLREYVKDSLSAAEFDLYPVWHYTHPDRGVPTTAPKMVEDYIYYAADDRNVYGISRDRKILDPYVLQGLPSTPVTLTSTNLYVGCRDYSVYALDRLTLKKKWTYPVGGPIKGTIYADEPDKVSLVMVPTENDGIHAVKVFRSANSGEKLKEGEKRDFTPEHTELGWKHAGDGVIGASADTMYIGEGKAPDFRGYAKVTAIDKESGEVKWSSASEGVSFYIEFTNSWRKRDQALRLYAVTADNRLLSFKEKKVDAGPLVEKKAEVKGPEGDSFKLQGSSKKPPADKPAADKPAEPAPAPAPAEKKDK